MRESRRLLAFGLAGALGFVVDTVVLYALKGLLGLFLGRAVSFSCAVVATWLINRQRTFRDRRSGHDPLGEFVRYFGLMLAGGAVHYASYSVAVLNFAAASERPVIGIAVGSVCGMVVNYLTTRFLMYRKPAASELANGD